MQNVHTLTIRVMTTYSVSFTSKHPHSLGGTLNHLKTATRHTTPRAKQELDLICSPQSLGDPDSKYSLPFIFSSDYEIQIKKKRQRYTLARIGHKKKI